MDDIPPEADHYIKETIEETLGLPVSAKTLRQKFAALEYRRHRLECQTSALREQVEEMGRRLMTSKAEAKMYAKAIKKCIGEKKEMLLNLEALSKLCFVLKELCEEHESNVDWIMARVAAVAKQDGNNHEEIDLQIQDLLYAVEDLFDEKNKLETLLNEASEKEIKLYESCKELVAGQVFR